MKWEPSYEGEVMILFGMLLPHLKETVLIKEYIDEFPDCKAEIDGEDVEIEFEVDSRNFYNHKHHEDPRLPKCSMIVCWKNPYNDVIKPQGHPIKILELSKVIKEKNLHLILAGPRRRPEEWNKEKFLDKLRENVGDGERYRWVKDLVEFCEDRPEFVLALGKGTRKATLGFQIRRWLSEGIGVPTPIQFGADGSFIFDHKGMPDDVERELRRRTREPKKRWYVIPIKDLETFSMVNEALRWLAETRNVSGQKT